MFVSRKYLALIHFVAREVPAGLDIAESAHQSIECGPPASTGSVHLEPFPKCSIQGLALRLGHKPGLIDQRFVGTQGNVLHTKQVYTIFVYLTRPFSLSARQRWRRRPA
jgi:hypothetical protein